MARKAVKKKLTVEERLDNVLAKATNSEPAEETTTKKKLKTAGPPHYSGKGKDGKSWRPTLLNPVKFPKIVLDPETLCALAYGGASITTMAKIIGMDRHYLADRINSEPQLKEAIERGQGWLEFHLSQVQLETALDNSVYGSVAMQIWLGKNRLGQAERPGDESQVVNKIELVWNNPPLPEAPKAKQIEDGTIIDAEVIEDSSDGGTSE